jgi:predicted SprT family Zn-dependent metalloprotease
MELHDAEQLARQLMERYYLSTWRFKWDNAKRTFGYCHFTTRTISLSRSLTLLNDRDQVEDTIRHEIAHALAAKSGHGNLWKSMCAVTGANPQRCYDESTRVEAGDWRATCAGCGHVHTKFRKPRRDLWCARKGCKRKLGSFHPLQRLTYRHVNEVFDPTRHAKEALHIAELKGGALPAPAAAMRAAIEQTKARLRREEEMEQMKLRIAELEKKLGRKV